MEFKVAWSPEDIESIVQYIGRDRELYAGAVARILDLGRDIKRFPLTGRIVPELDDEQVREHLVYSYRVIYNVQEDRILIVAVIHGKRLIDNILNRFGSTE